MMCFLASSVIKIGLGYTPVKLCPLILTMFDSTTFAGNGFAQKKSFVSSIVYYNQQYLCIPAKFHDLSVMLTNLKDSHDLTIVF